MTSKAPPPMRLRPPYHRFPVPPDPVISRFTHVAEQAAATVSATRRPW